MKSARLLVIFTFLALNCGAQWHTNAPFVAWPATNHLRWVDNVGVYTNVSIPTNSGYGAWTNNYHATNTYLFVAEDYWYDTDHGVYRDMIMYWPFPILDYAQETNVILNAKEVRAFDCMNGLCERFLAAFPAESISNFWEYAIPYDSRNDIYDYELWRDERKIIESLKAFIKGRVYPNIYSKFYYGIPTNSTPTNWVAFTEETLCDFAGVPTNFLTYTPHRAADGSWTHYQRILTNTFTLRQGTNATHSATNNLVDSAGISFTAIGTNGQTVTRYATNLNQQAGHDIGAYGWDGLKSVINCMTVTVASQSWGIGSGTNWDASYLSNFPAISVGNYSEGAVGDVLDDSVFSNGLVAAYSIPYINRTDDWLWKFSDALASGVPLQKTNTAPYAASSVNWRAGIQIRYIWNLSGGLTRVGGVPPWYLAGTNMVYQNDANSYFYHVRSNSVSWNNYASPLVIPVGADISFSATAMHYIKTNGVSSFFASNEVTSALSTRTSAVYRITQPDLSGDFGVKIRGSDSGELSYFDPSAWSYPEWPNIGYYSLWYLCGSWTSNTLSGADLYGVQSASTNWTLPIVTTDKTVLLWDFKYQ